MLLLGNVKHLGKSPDIKRQALQLYLEGLGFRSIGRFLNCSHVAVYNWIRAHGESIEPLRSDKDIEVVELDEMPLLAKKNYCLESIYTQGGSYGKLQH